MLEFFVVVPLCTYPYASTTVVLISVVVRIVAPLSHANPNVIKALPFAMFGIAVGGFSDAVFSANVLHHAPATPNVAAVKGGGRCNFLFAAVALAPP